MNTLYVKSRRHQDETADKEKSTQGLYDNYVINRFASYFLCADQYLVKNVIKEKDML